LGFQVLLSDSDRAVFPPSGAVAVGRPPPAPHAGSTWSPPWQKWALACRKPPSL